MMSATPHIIGIAGPTCSGKSELARYLAHQLSEMGPVILSLDAYYHDLSSIDPEARKKRNFDLPEALDLHLFREQLTSLANGGEIEMPVYDFSTHTRSPQQERISAAGLVIVEGLFVLYWKEIRDLLHTSVFVSLHDHVCLSRRLARDIRERGRTRESVLAQYADTVRPMNEQYILPTKQFAKIIVNGEDPLDRSTTLIMSRIGSAIGPPFFTRQSSVVTHHFNPGDGL